MLAAALPAGSRVLSEPGRAPRQHAALAPPRRADAARSRGSPEELLEAGERALRAGRVDLLAVTGASNVTGEIWPLAELAELAHRHGAELFVDAAQLAPHRPIDMAGSGIDHLALSGHKLYAPFGAGALVAGGRWLARRGAAAARRRRRQARARSTSRLGGRPRAPRGGLAGRRRRRGAGGGVPAAARARDGDRSRRTSRRWRSGCGAAWRTCPACACSGSGRRRPSASAWRRSRSTATRTRGSRRSSAPSTRSASATAASARTR